MRRLNQQDGLHGFLGDILQPEEAGIGKFKQEELTGLAFGMDTQLQLDLEMQVVATPGLDVDAELDLRPLGQAGRRAGIFERQVLDGGPLTRKSREIRACGVFDEPASGPQAPPELGSAAC